MSLSYTPGGKRDVGRNESMGWSKLRRSRVDLYYGDETLDATADLLSALCRSYQESELRRLPMLDEILFNLETVLSANLTAYCSDGEGSELTALSAKKKKAPVQKKSLSATSWRFL
jgi:hypothetical protein